jgi:hypothetical protein
MTSRLTGGLAIAAVAATLFAGTAAAQTTDIASGGNGGVSTANSDGGSVTVGTTDNGGNVGSTTVISGGSIDAEAIAAEVLARIFGH